jgi:hypothetical protein
LLTKLTLITLPFTIDNKKDNMKNTRNKLERKLDEYNHTMELIRTIVPIVILCLQVIILLKIM